MITRHVEHKNVLSVLGQATEQEPFLVILEHTPVVSYIFVSTYSCVPYSGTRFQLNSFSFS